jgi:hypothetical protein
MLTDRSIIVIARVAVWEPMPTDDRDWVIDAAAGVPGVRATYHLLDPQTGNGLSIAIFDDEEAAQAAGAAIRRRAEEIGWNNEPRPRFAAETIYQVLRGKP